LHEQELYGIRNGGACTYHDYGNHQHQRDIKQNTEYEHHVAPRFGVHLSFRLLRYGGSTSHAAPRILGGLGWEEGLDEFLNLDPVLRRLLQIPETEGTPTTPPTLSTCNADLQEVQVLGRLLNEPRPRRDVRRATS
jgi:hypothetical protein